jgi:hypothetical protein
MFAASNYAMFPSMQHVDVTSQRTSRNLMRTTSVNNCPNCTLLTNHQPVVNEAGLAHSRIHEASESDTEIQYCVSVTCEAGRETRRGGLTHKVAIMKCCSTKSFHFRDGNTLATGTPNRFRQSQGCAQKSRWISVCTG